MKKLTNTDFISKSIITHKNIYLYTLTNYINTRTKVKIICKEHGIFEQTPNNHLKGKGCPICFGRLKSNINSFITKAEIKHDFFYDYSLVHYNGSKNKVKIICPEHGVFEQTPNDHLRGNKCIKCSLKYQPTTQEFIVNVTKLHNNKYDYSLTEYINNKTKIKIICPEHDVFEQTPSNHLKGKGCEKCAGRCKSTIAFIDQAVIKHGKFYDYSLVDYTMSRVKINIVCPDHGIFKQTPSAHLTGQGCPICKESKGEKEIKKTLTDLKITFIQEKRFPLCKNIKPLPFDFYLPELNICIEYDGVQHFKPINYFGGIKAFTYREKLDLIKSKFCRENNIKLLRMSNTNNIEKDLIKYLLLQNRKS